MVHEGFREKKKQADWRGRKKRRSLRRVLVIELKFESSGDEEYLKCPRLRAKMKRRGGPPALLDCAGSDCVPSPTIPRRSLFPANCKNAK